MKKKKIIKFIKMIKKKNNNYSFIEILIDEKKINKYLLF
ncbi:DUF4295 domain-containing protein [Candidatus Shikimatogenerans bostrichidophilus]